MQDISLRYNGIFDIFGPDTLLSPSYGCLVDIKIGLADLVVQVDICFIFHRSDSDTSSSVFTWRMMLAIDCNKTLSVASSR